MARTRAAFIQQALDATLTELQKTEQNSKRPGTRLRRMRPPVLLAAADARRALPTQAAIWAALNTSPASRAAAFRSRAGRPGEYAEAC